MQENMNILASFMEKTAEISQKINKGSQTISHIDKIEVGTAPKEEVWQMDKVKLYHYQRSTPPNIKTPMLISYALINRYDMLDLQPDRSLVRKLLDLGLDIYVLDTGYPTRNERYLTMNDYINVYINGAVDYIRQAHQIPAVNLMGICQGGTFSLIYSSLHPHKIKNLVTLVTPVDFSHNDGLLYRWARDLDVDAIVEGFGGLIPGTFLDAGFQLLKPMLKVRKQTNFINMLDSEDKLMNFYRMEKWINDLPDQAGETYRQFIKDLYQQNKLVKGELIIGEHQVNLKNITMPTLTIYASEDHLVPPSSTKPLNELIGSKDKQLYEFPGGHIGVFTGQRSQKELGPTIHEWFKERDAVAAKPASTPQKESKKAEKVEEKATTTKPEPVTEAIQPTQIREEATEAEKPKAKEPSTEESPSPKKENESAEITSKAANFDLSNIGKASEADKNDLKKINGIGTSLEEKLNAIGIYTYEQVSKLTDEELETISKIVNFAYSRIQKNDWVGQAKALL